MEIIKTPGSISVSERKRNSIAVLKQGPASNKNIQKSEMNLEDVTSKSSVSYSVQDRGLSHKKKNLKKLIDLQQFNRQLVPNNVHQLKPVSDYEKARASLAA